LATTDERRRWGGAPEASVGVAGSRAIAGMASGERKSPGLPRPGQFPTGKRAPLDKCLSKDGLPNTEIEPRKISGWALSAEKRPENWWDFGLPNQP
jgi:hypothetical protein